MMNNQIAESNRRLVIVVDPQVKFDINYHVYANAIQLENSSTENNVTNIFMRQDGDRYVGQGWPGETVWIDFLNTNA